MIVPLLVLVAALGAALAVLAARLRRWQAVAQRADARLSKVGALVAQAASAGRAALTSAPEQPPPHAAASDPRSETAAPRPSRRARRAPALPDRP